MVRNAESYKRFTGFLATFASTKGAESILLLVMYTAPSFPRRLSTLYGLLQVVAAMFKMGKTFEQNAKNSPAGFARGSYKSGDSEIERNKHCIATGKACPEEYVAACHELFKRQNRREIRETPCIHGTVESALPRHI